MNETPDRNDDGSEQILLPFDPPLEMRDAVGSEPSEIETLRTENEDLKRALRLRDARDQLAGELRAAGAQSPDLLFTAAKDALQFGDDGRVENPEAVIADLKLKFPEQFGRSYPASIDGGAGSLGNTSSLTKDALAAMKPHEIARLDWAAVRQALSN